MREIHLWVPELDVTKGGIQAFSYFFHAGLRQVLAPVQLRVLARQGVGSEGLGFHWPGWLSRLVFSAALLHGAWRARPMLVLSTHVNFLPAAHWLKRLCQTRYVGVAHGIDTWGNLRPGLRAALGQADMVLGVSRFTRDQLARDHHVAHERLALLPNTFAEALFHPGPKSPVLLQRYRLPTHAPVVFTFGRLAAAERYKGFDRIIAALPRIQRDVPNVHYLIGGTGDDRPRLEALARDAGMADRVRFTGFIPADELCAHYNLCDVFAMPSTGEGFGIVFLEAMACGKPVLAGNRDGSVDPLADGRFGALVDPLDSEQLAGTLTQLLQCRYSHPLMWQPEELRRQVVAEFGFEKFSATLKTHLRRLLPSEMLAAD
ncbi:MAG: glycosyltransferase family 4 protein [Acidobacteria bacterium]|nr:glycosyltransferase family 4 protein [Acidobacteriota bacterium]